MALLLCSACSGKRNDDVLPSAKLEAVLYDYHIAQAIVNDLPASQRFKKDLYFDYVYSKHGVTKAEVDSSLVYYARHPKGLSEIYENLSVRVKADLQRLDNEDKPLPVRQPQPIVGDSANLWYDVLFVEMNASPLDNRYSLTIPTDTNFRPLDRIVWGGEVVFLDDEVDSLYKYIHLNLRVAYMNDSIVSADTLLYTSGSFSISVTDSAVVKRVDGEAYLKSTDADERVLILSPSLMRYRGSSDTLTVVADSAVVEQQKRMMDKEKPANKLMKPNEALLQKAH